jgi:pimeloyl-ACP methyl ester carboxylesterase
MKSLANSLEDRKNMVAETITNRTIGRSRSINQALVAVAMVLFAVVLLCFAGFAYNTIANARLARAHPVPGTFYTVDGRRMHIDCTGEGSPTIILESGIGDDWLIWQAVQPELSTVSRVCSYDRLGLGWSEPTIAPRDATAIAAQLHALLSAAHISGPLLLVGHSGGGLYVRAFAAIYPENVIGLICIDATSTKVFQTIPGAAETDSQRRLRHYEAHWRAFKELIGWTRLTDGCGPDVPPPLQHFADLDAAEECRPTYETSSLGERDQMQRSAEEVADLPCCGRLPTLIISQDPDRNQPGWGPQNMAERHIWGGLQEQMKSLSSCSRRIIARSSGHHVMIDRPDVIVRNVKAFLHQQKVNPECPFDGGTEVD